jgi:hypothetical protein
VNPGHDTTLMDDNSERAEASGGIRPGAAAQGNTGSSRRRRAVLLTGASIVLAVGLFLGFVLAYTASQGGMAGALGALFFSFAIAAGIGLTVVFGLIAAAFRRSRRIGTGALAVAGILVAGVLAGFALTPVLGLEYREPVTREARGTASARLDGGVAFTPVEPGYATCRSEPGSDTMSSMELDLGRLGSGLLRGSVSISEAGSAEAWVELRVDAADDAEGVFQPEWLGTSEMTQLSERGTSGRVSFQKLRRGTETASRGDAANDPWPSTLSGSLSWACEATLDPFATAPPSQSGSVGLRLDGVDWSQPPLRAKATCEFEPDGSVAYVTGSHVGLLQGLPVDVNLDGLSDREGFLFSIRLSGKDPPPGQRYIPNWDGRIRHERDVTGNASGRASFSDLRTGVDPDVTPPQGWPLSLTGSVDWSCGEDDPSVGLVGDDR